MGSFRWGDREVLSNRALGGDLSEAAGRAGSLVEERQQLGRLGGCCLAGLGGDGGL